MTIVTYKDLQRIRETNKGKKIVFCSGTFDLTHAGHVLFFEDCKKEGDLLLVCLGGDALIKQYKGDKRPVMNETVRMKMVDSIKVVDYTLLDETKEMDHRAMFESVFRDLKPDVWVINEDSQGIAEKQKTADHYGIRLVVLKRWCPPEFESISTSKLIERIKDVYLSP